MWDSEFIGEAILDKEFSVSAPENQKYLLDLCAAMKTKWFILDGSVVCWIEAFKTYLEKNNQQFPVPQNEFDQKLIDWTKNNLVGKTFKSTKALGFVNDKLVYMEFEGKSNVSLREPSDTKQPFYDGWEDLIAEWKAKAPQGLKSIKQSGGFAWVWMPSE